MKKYWRARMAEANVRHIEREATTVTVSVLFCGVCGSHMIDSGYTKRGSKLGVERIQCCSCGWGFDVTGAAIGRTDIPVASYFDAITDCAPKPLVFRLGQQALTVWARFAEFIRTRLMKSCDDRCEYCGDDQSLSVDHRVPIARGGDNHVTNLAVACAACNSRKGPLTPEEWDQSKRVMSAGVDRDQGL
jgi:hypothetical protein